MNSDIINDFLHVTSKITIKQLQTILRMISICDKDPDLFAIYLYHAKKHGINDDDLLMFNTFIKSISMELQKNITTDRVSKIVDIIKTFEKK